MVVILLWSCNDLQPTSLHISFMMTLSDNFDIFAIMQTQWEILKSDWCDTSWMSLTSPERYVQPTRRLYIQQGDEPETAVSTKLLSTCQSSLTTVTTVLCFKDSEKCNLHWAKYSMFVAIQKQSIIYNRIRGTPFCTCSNYKAFMLATKSCNLLPSYSSSHAWCAICSLLWIKFAGNSNSFWTKDVML